MIIKQRINKYLMENTGFGKDVPPLKEHVIIYFVQKGCVEKDAIDFFAYFYEKRWKNYQGKTLSNWKMAAWEWVLKRR